MHIGIICEEFPPAPHGGTGSSYYDLATGLAEAGHHISVAGIYSPETVAAVPSTAPVQNLSVARLRYLPKQLPYRFWMLGNRLRLKRWLIREHRRRPFDVIECSDYGGWLSHGGPPGVPTITKIRGSNLFFDHELGRPGDPVEARFERQCLDRATFLGAVSRYAAEHTLKLCGLSHRPCTVIYNAVDTQIFSPDDSVPTEPGLITFVNTINPKKGIGELIDAMPLVWKSHPEARLAVIGGETQKTRDGKRYLESLQERIPPDQRDRVTFLGRLDRRHGVVEYLRKANVCCYPSHMETFGIGAIEAMSVGKPTIFSKTGPGPEVIEDGVSGLLCDPHDPADIAQKILAVLDNPALAQTLGANARRRVEKLFDKRDWNLRNLDFYEKAQGASRCRNRMRSRPEGAPGD